jgi:DNA-binding transcriptional LysR family regulator
MTDFSNSELRRLDLTVLLVFLGLLRHRKATDVAKALGLTQSGVSQALKRLRDIFDDDLFLRRPHGMEPTAIALGLEAPVAAAVESLRSSLGRGQPFVPANTSGIVRLAALDAEQANLVPGLVRHMASQAPQLRLSVLPLARREAMEALSNNDVDLAIGFFWDVPDSLLSVPLYQQDFVVVGRAEVLGNKPITLERYANLSHVLVSPAGDLSGVADDALKSRGLSRKVIASVPQFFPALATVAETDCITTLPRGLAQRYAPALDLIIQDPPLELRSIMISALRHRRNEHDQRLLWILKCLVNDFIP